MLRLCSVSRWMYVNNSYKNMRNHEQEKELRHAERLSAIAFAGGLMLGLVIMWLIK